MGKFHDASRRQWFGAEAIYDSSGKVVDEDSVAITCLRRDNDEVTHVLKVPAARSLRPDATCADTIEWRDIPAGSYKEGALGRFTVNGRGAAVGPSLLRSGGVSFGLLSRTATPLAPQRPSRRRATRRSRCGGASCRASGATLPTTTPPFTLRLRRTAGRRWRPDRRGARRHRLLRRRGMKKVRPPRYARWNALAADAVDGSGATGLASFDASRVLVGRILGGGGGRRPPPLELSRTYSGRLSAAKGRPARSSTAAREVPQVPLHVGLALEAVARRPRALRALDAGPGWPTAAPVLGRRRRGAAGAGSRRPVVRPRRRRREQACYLARRRRREQACWLRRRREQSCWCAAAYGAGGEQHGVALHCSPHSSSNWLQT